MKKRMYFNKKNLNYIIISLFIIFIGISLHFLANITGFAISNTITQADFDEGTYSTSFYNTSGFIQLNNTDGLIGNYTSKIFDVNGTATWNNISWTSGVPYGKELPNTLTDELTNNILGGANMTGNVLLLHLNNDSTNAENDTHTYDFSGIGNNGTILNAIWNTSGKFGGAFEFDGSSTLISNVTTKTLVSDYPFTISAWISTTSATGTLFTLAKGDATNVFYTIDISGGQARALVRNTASKWAQGTSTINDGNWHHVVGLFENDTYRVIYVDGVFEDSDNISVDFNTGVDRWAIGVLYDLTPSTYWDGTIDEVAIWNRTLSNNEILNIYKRGSAKLNITIKSCNDGSCDTESWNDTFNQTPSNISINDNRYFQYRVDLESENKSIAPELYNITIDYTLDTSNPTINTISPTNNSADNDGNITFEYNVSDASTISNCSFIINTIINQTETTITKDITLKFDLNNTASGSYNWSFNCTDSSNNIGNSEIRTFSIIKTIQFSGGTTNLSAVSNISNISNFIIENNLNGKINFTNNVDLSSGYDIDTNVNISNNRIELNSTILTGLNKAARLTFYNLTFSDPRPLKNGADCPPEVCNEISYSNGEFVFDVTGFSIYSSEETPSTSISSSAAAGESGGGGSSMSYPKIESGFKINKESIKIKLSTQQLKTETIIIENQNPNIVKLNIDLNGTIKNLIDISGKSFDLYPKESKIIKLNIKSEEDIGIYNGYLTFKSGPITKRVELIIEIESIDRQIDANIDLPSGYKKIMAGGEIKPQITLFDIGDNGEMETNINYIIKDMNGKEIKNEEETIILNKQISFNKKLSLKDIPPGVYIVGIEVRYANSIATSTEIFEIIGEEIPQIFTKKGIIMFSIFGLTIILIFVFLIVFIGKKIR